ncbi:MAG: M28 family peptidase [Bacteroidota bacterium]
MNKKLVVLPFFLIWYTLLFSQNLIYVRGVIDTLSSPDFFGRGYVNNGDKIASDFIVKQLKKDNLKQFDTSYLQRFGISVNTFPGLLDLKINNISVQPGIDYLVLPDAQTVKKTYGAIVLNGKTAQSGELKNLKNVALVVDTGFKDLNCPSIKDAPLILFIKDKEITWESSQSQNTKKHVEVIINRNAIPKKISKISIDINAQLIKNYQTQNVIGYIPGKLYPDTFVVFGAHYDHLGMMGNKTYFPGANDNASGTAMLLDLAAYYSNPANQPEYSMAFIFFAGEELGLLGSEYYTNHPVFPLKKIKFMLNLDMVGTGSDGIKVVNGSIFKKEFELLKQLNETGKFLKSVNVRGEAANSDHYFYYEKGVKCFFIYTLGNEYKEYHTLADKAMGLPLTKYPELFQLVLSFVKSL